MRYEWYSSGRLTAGYGRTARSLKQLITSKGEPRR